MTMFEAQTWRVSLFLSVRSRCRISQPVNYSKKNISIRIGCDGNRVLNSLHLTSPTKFKFVPQLGGSRIFEPTCPNCDELIQASQRFEGMFAPFGLIAVDHQCPSWKWEYRSDEKSEWIKYFAYDTEFDERPIYVECMTQENIRRLAELSLDESADFDALTLTLCREGNNHFQEGRFIDAIRSFYHAVEHHCGESKSGKHQVINALNGSEELRKAYCNATDIVKVAIRNGDLSSALADKIYFKQSFYDFLAYFYHKRGEISHQKAKMQKSDKWWPSSHIRFKADAILIRAVAMSFVVLTTTKYFESDAP